MANFTGDSGDNSFVGTSDIDTFNMEGGGEDTVDGGGGADNIFFDGGLDAGDHLDGGDGDDSLILNGDYSAGLVFTDTTMVNVENIQLTAGHSYDLTFAAGTAVDGVLHVQASALGVGDRLRIDAAAFTAGHGVQFNVGQSRATVTGGAGDDSINSGSGGPAAFNGNAGNDTAIVFHALTHADRFDGGDGVDTVFLTMVGDLVLTGKMLKQVEILNLADANHPASVTMSDGNLASGKTLIVTQQAAQSFAFDGSAERSGAFQVFGNSSDDTLIGGGGSDSLTGSGGHDVLTGGRGADILTGGGGGDSFVFAKLSDSGHHRLFDLITDLDSSDTIDLSAIDANSTKAGDQAFHIVSQLSGHAGELAVSYDAGANLTTVAGDANGDGRADIAFHITGDATGFEGWAL